MEAGHEKYNKAVRILRRSKPELKGSEVIGENVIRMIGETKGKHASFQDLLETIFAWTYVGWVRRSLVTASLLLVLFFVYQQTMILRGVNEISKREIKSSDGTSSISANRIERQLMMFRLTGKGLAADKTTISKEQLEQILESYNELQNKYSNLIRIIEEDPELKAYVEKKINDSNNKKTNL
ncbi:MAG: hypothetical protein Q8868_11245 [Bacteroidota bacterium]|nr:hypothetical protein [Bacteroidota bacterium]